MTTTVPSTNNAQSYRFGSLRWRIYLGFAVIIGILCVIGGFSLAGLRTSMKHFESYCQIEDLSHELLRIDREVQVLQLKVNHYVDSSDSKNRIEVEAQAERLLNMTQSVAPRVNNERMRVELTRMNELLAEYQRRFEEVAAERRLCSELLKAKLPAQASRVRTELELLVTALNQTEYHADRLAILDAQQRFNIADQEASGYSSDAAQTKNASAIKNLAEARELLGALVSVSVSPNKPDVMNAVNAISDYENTYLRAAKATERYRNLVDVVMVEVATEFADASSQLQEEAELQSFEISQTTLTEADATRRVTAACLGIALIIGTLISGRLAYRIVRPISRITETFQNLAEGVPVKTIPGIERRDELGDMANAAAVFQEKNSQTVKLLDQSRKLTEQLSAKADEMEQINLELDNFAYVASHDLKSPLRGIGQLASWVVEDANELLPRDSQVHLEKLQHRVDKMETMLNNLLDYSRVGRNDETFESLDCHRMLLDVIELVDNPSGIEIQISGEMPTFRTVRAPLEQVFVNLLTNAIKHHDQPSTGRVELSVEESAEFYRFSVSDDGPGIEPKQHLRIFQMYQRVCDPAVDGCGMGLAIIKKQIELRGGSIGVDSTPGFGSRFYFTWPKCFSPDQFDEAVSEGLEHVR